MALERKLQCFISSTYDDLAEERMVCINTILDAGHIPTGMEYFRAGKMQKTIIEKYIQESDLVFLILGGRYGTVDPATKIGYVEWEYNYARDLKKVVIPIILNDSYIYEKESAFKAQKKNLSAVEKKHKSLYKKFKKRIKDEAGECVFVNKIEDLRDQVRRNIDGILRYENDSLLGWIRYEPRTIVDILESDMSKIPDSNKKVLLRKLLTDKLANNGKTTNYMLQIANKLEEKFEEYKYSMKKYIDILSRSITIVLKDECIEITNSTNITYITVGSAEGMSFKWNPWLYEGIESKTYSFLYIYYNQKKIPLSQVKRGVQKYTQNPFYVSDVISIEIPFDASETKHNIRYKTKYCVDYDRFFHEYVFTEFCNNFSLTLDMIDQRQDKKDKEYMIKWAMFTPHKSKGFSSTNMLEHEKNRIRFNVSDLMVPGTGYITTLSSAKLGLIKYHSIREET